MSKQDNFSKNMMVGLIIFNAVLQIFAKNFLTKTLIFTLVFVSLYVFGIMKFEKVEKGNK